MSDVVVVGGGIVGAACAWELAGRGLSVTLLERGELAAGASGRNHGLMLTPPDPSLVPMFEASLALYRELEDAAPIPFGLDREPLGFLIAAGEDRGERAAGREEAEAVAASGVELEHLVGDEVHEVEPSLSRDLVEGWLLRDGRRLDPAALTVSLALASGAEVRRHTTVRSLRTRGEAVVGVVTDDGPVDADWVVLAAGPWTAGLARPLGIELPLTGARGWLVHLRPTQAPLRHLVERAGWHVVGGDDDLAPMTARALAEASPRADVGTLLQPNPDGTLLVGGSRQRVVTAEPEDPGVARELVRRAAAMVPALGEAAVLSAWWGIRPMTPSGRPLVGLAQGGLVIATGHGSQGVILGGGTARFVGALVSGGPPPFDPAPFEVR